MPSHAEITLMIPGPAGRLQAAWQPADTASAQVAVVCHPHPLHGGTMDNKVVTTVARAFRDRGYPVLRFNFRGTGDSEGVHDHGRGEVDDLLAVLDWLRESQQTAQVSLAGFSFGAWVCAAASTCWPRDLQLERLLLVAPPVHYEGFQQLQTPAGTVVMMGDQDEVVDPGAMRAWAGSRREPCRLQVFPGAGHFFHGRLAELRAEVASLLDD